MGDPMTPIEPNTNSALLVAQVHRWRTAFFGVVVLLAGVAIGIGSALIWAGHRIPIGYRSVSKPPNMDGQRFDPGVRLIATLGDYLQLSDEQVRGITPIVREHMANIQRIRKEVRPKVAEELRSMDKRISAALNKDQRRKWDRRFRLLQEKLQWQSPPYRGRSQDLKGPIPPQGRPGESRLPTPPNQPDHP